MTEKTEVPKFGEVLIKKTIGGKWTAQVKFPEGGVQSKMMEYPTFDDAVAYIKESYDV
tara:strand:- start:23071 stop:23244 length:174 start_codon:yes stop_codon:yes gene_type:complete